MALPANNFAAFSFSDLSPALSDKGKTPKRIIKRAFIYLEIGVESRGAKTFCPYFFSTFFPFTSMR